MESRLFTWFRGRENRLDRAVLLISLLGTGACGTQDFSAETKSRLQAKLEPTAQQIAQLALQQVAEGMTATDPADDLTSITYQQIGFDSISGRAYKYLVEGKVGETDSLPDANRPVFLKLQKFKCSDRSIESCTKMSQTIVITRQEPSKYGGDNWYAEIDEPDLGFLAKRNTVPSDRGDSDQVEAAVTIAEGIARSANRLAEEAF